MAPEIAERCRKEGTVPLLRDGHGRPLKRNFVHVDDLVDAILAAFDNPATKGNLYNVCMDEPVAYGAVASHLKECEASIRSIFRAAIIRTGWTTARPNSIWAGTRNYDLAKLIEAAWTYRREDNDPRKIWYPS